MSELDVDAYQLLELTNEVTEAEIRKAYRQKSLKVHPDRVSLSSVLMMSDCSKVESRQS